MKSGEAAPADVLPDATTTTPKPRPTDGALIPPEAVAAPPAAAPLPPKRQAEGALVPPDEMACRARLTGLGVVFSTQPAEQDEAGCSMPYPLKIKSLSKTIQVEPEIVVNCRTAEAAALFLRDHVAPLVRRDLGSDLVSIRQDSGYVCRPRNGTSTLSEHAFGNAIDIGAFRLADGRDIAVEKTADGRIGRFLAKVRAAACGPFKTVLGPGSDADHATHFHFDMAERRGGSAYCR